MEFLQAMFYIFIVMWMLFTNHYLHKSTKLQKQIIDEIKEVRFRIRG